MTDEYADELIPWHFYNAKTLEDANVLRQVSDLNDLQRRATARKGFVTRALNRISGDKAYHDKFKLKGKQSHARYDESRMFLEVRMAMIVNVYRRIYQVVQLDKPSFEKEFEEITKVYFDGKNN